MKTTIAYRFFIVLLSSQIISGLLGIAFQLYFFSSVSLFPTFGLIFMTVSYCHYWLYQRYKYSLLPHHFSLLVQIASSTSIICTAVLYTIQTNDKPWWIYPIFSIGFTIIDCVLLICALEIAKLFIPQE